MIDFHCPHCQKYFTNAPHTYKTHYFDFNNQSSISQHFLTSNNAYSVHIYKCPHCNKETVLIKGFSENNSHINVPVSPVSLAIRFPDYVPKAIREDYEESYAILHLSPKASATLSRRCLQGIIRDFWNINDKNLAKQINALENTIDTKLWQAMDGLRKIGNIGAHMEKDVNTIIPVESYEAEQLVKLIEVLIKTTYVERHDREQLCNEIIEISEEKQTLKKS